jgi:TatD DNase family protein
VAHCFTGDAAQLEDYLALGLFIGVTGWVCDERRGASLRDSVPRIPSDRLMLETDAPYLLPRDLQPPPKSRRNEPKYLVHIAHTVAHIRNESWESVAVSSTQCAVKFFGLKDS